MSNAVSFRSNFIRLLSWSSFSQAFSFIALPFVSRLYTPYDFGILASFLSINSILASFISFRFEWYIPNTQEQKQANLYALWAIFLSFVFVGITSAVFLFFPISIGEFNREISQYILFMSVTQAFFSVLHNIASKMAVKIGELKYVARANLLISLSNTLLLLLLGGLKWGYQGLIWGFIVSHFVAVIYIVSHFEWEQNALPSYEEIKTHFFKTYKTATVTTSVSVLNNLSHSVITLMIVNFFNSYTAGIYFMGAKLINAPVRLLASSIGLSFWSEASKKFHHNAKELRENFVTFTQRMLGLSFFLCVLIYFFSPLVPYVLDEKWKEVSTILFAFSPIVIGNLCFSSLDHLIVMNKYHYKLYGDITRLCLVVLAVYCSSQFSLSPVYMVFSITMASLIGHFISFLMHLVAYRNILEE